ncbi:predicted protein [Lichtheimia corymbifera JMRC:FSU:9682]|uniref:Uncharacterized protein n=1 Tax=Lichtheimia corymbifera JMRC:FSU:9682 TaxID=1263082 RepID=A0A068SDS2_9FUNG|nr:predicted protein [Lichtheimia corymbifera JMRC:FSU:9682]
MLRGYFPGCQHKEWIMTRVCGSFIRPKDFTTTDDMQEDMTWLLGYVFKYVTTAMVIDYHGSGSFQENKAEETCLWIYKKLDSTHLAVVFGCASTYWVVLGGHGDSNCIVLDVTRNEAPKTAVVIQKIILLAWIP